MDRKIVLVIVVIILVGIGGYFIFVNKSGQTLQQPTPISQDETANWKTYSNSQYGFEIKYPPGWNFETIPSHDAAGKVIATQSDFLFTDLTTLHRVIVAPFGFGGGNSSDVTETRNINLNGTTGNWRKFVDSGGLYLIMVDQLHIKQYPQFTISLLPINARPDIDLEKIHEFDQILSTLKFI